MKRYVAAGLAGLLFNLATPNLARADLPSDGGLEAARASFEKLSSDLYAETSTLAKVGPQCQATFFMVSVGNQTAANLAETAPGTDGTPRNKIENIKFWKDRLNKMMRDLLAKEKDAAQKAEASGAGGPVSKMAGPLADSLESAISEELASIRATVAYGIEQRSGTMGKAAMNAVRTTTVDPNCMRMAKAIDTIDALNTKVINQLEAVRLANRANQKNITKWAGEVNPPPPPEPKPEPKPEPVPPAPTPKIEPAPQVPAPKPAPAAPTPAPKPAPSLEAELPTAPAPAPKAPPSGGGEAHVLPVPEAKPPQPKPEPKPQPKQEPSTAPVPKLDSKPPVHILPAPEAPAAKPKPAAPEDDSGVIDITPPRAPDPKPAPKPRPKRKPLPRPPGLVPHSEDCDRPLPNFLPIQDIGDIIDFLRNGISDSINDINEGMGQIFGQDPEPAPRPRNRRTVPQDMPTPEGALRRGPKMGIEAFDPKKDIWKAGDDFEWKKYDRKRASTGKFKPPHVGAKEYTSVAKRLGSDLISLESRVRLQKAINSLSRRLGLQGEIGPDVFQDGVMGSRTKDAVVYYFRTHHAALLRELRRQGFRPN